AARALHALPTRRSSDLVAEFDGALEFLGRADRIAGMEIEFAKGCARRGALGIGLDGILELDQGRGGIAGLDMLPGALEALLPSRSEEHTSELQSRENLV